MIRLRHSMLVLGAAALLASPALAQPQGGGRGMGMGRVVGMQILRAPAAHAELGLSEDQIQKFTALGEELGGSMMEKMQGLRDLPPEERQAKSAALMTEIEKEIAGKVKEVLDPKQMERFQQIRLQALGVQAFSTPAVIDGLKITEAQQDKIKGLITELESNTREAFQDAQGDFRAAGEKITALRKEAFERVVKELSDEQKAAWKELSGKPFELPMMGPGGGRPGGGRPGGGRPPGGAPPAQ
jgi:Spy/CpxP family protein refolding chaperone